MSDTPNYRPETLAVRAGQERSQFGEHSEALYLTSSYGFDSAAQAASGRRRPHALLGFLFICDRSSGVLHLLEVGQKQLAAGVAELDEVVHRAVRKTPVGRP